MTIIRPATISDIAMCRMVPDICITNCKTSPVGSGSSSGGIYFIMLDALRANSNVIGGQIRPDVRRCNSSSSA